MEPHAPPDTRPGALVLAGVRRGFLVVFLPVALGAQVVAFLGFAISGAYGPWSWVKIGLGYALMSARVPFDVTVRRSATLTASDASVPRTLALALGALTIAVVVLAFRAGRAQARGLERDPGQAVAAGVTVGLGLALPMGIVAILVRLSFPRAGVTALEPVLWTAFTLPLVLVCASGAAGGLTAARGALARGGPGAFILRAARAAASMVWWGLVFGTIAFLVLIAVRPSATRWYARTLGDAGAGGAVAIVHHALLVPNQSAMILATASGSPVRLTAGDTILVSVSLTEVDATGFGGDAIALGRGYLVFLLVPALAAIMGGRSAGEGARSARVAIACGALAGGIYALLAGVLAWASSVQAPLPGLGSQASLGSAPAVTAALGAAWGVAGGVVGALIGPSASERASAQVTSA
jgi:hypothetical protein